MGGSSSRDRDEALVFPRAKRLRDFQDLGDHAICVRVRRPPSLPLPPRCLVVVHGAALGRRYELGDGTLTLGRSATNDIRIVDDSVSRTHAIITAGRDGVKVCDNHSKNGILVNGVRIRECVLSCGDIVNIGHTIFAFATLDPGTSTLEVLIQMVRVRIPTELPCFDRAVSDDADPETETVEAGAAESGLAAP